MAGFQRHLRLSGRSTSIHRPGAAAFSQDDVVEAGDVMVAP